MLTKITVPAMPVIKKQINGIDVSHRGAFAVGACIVFSVDVPRRLGASAVVLRICRDGESDCDLPFSFEQTEEGCDRYTLSLDTVALCGEAGEGLFFYEFLFVRGTDTLFTATRNQVDFTLEDHSDSRFVLLLHRADYTTPSWFRGKVMYHIFVDRFCRGEGDVAQRSDVILNEDWDNGIPQYPEHNGDRLANNMFFGGNLWGIAEKLPYLQSLGVGVLYLSPIFRAYSNHKYDTGDYLEIDGMFGGEAAFRHLLDKAKQAGIRILLDGVFNHTGDDSLYFDRYGTYGGVGAYTDAGSPYRDWYCFRNYPDQYETWWGIDILPKLNLAGTSCREFLAGRGGVGETYIRMGIDGWRLDVADELPNAFLEELRQTVKEASHGEGMLLGEVWENAVLKEAYGNRRRYFWGGQLDSVMNYPLRNGILGFVLDGDAEFLSDVLKEIYATYPQCVCHNLMNILGTHDTERILTVLGEGDERDFDASNETLAHKRLNEVQRSRGMERLKIAAAIQYTVYGVPSVFYGDEVGLEGYGDPFCRRPYPWGNEDGELLAFYRKLGKIRREHAVFAEGEFRVRKAENGILAYVRENSNEQIIVFANVGGEPYSCPLRGAWLDLLTDKRYDGTVLPGDIRILTEQRRTKET